MYGVYDPASEYKNRLEELHRRNTVSYFEKVTRESGIDVEENRRTTEEIRELIDNKNLISKRIMLLKAVRVVLFVTVILIPAALLFVNPVLKQLKTENDQESERGDMLRKRAEAQVKPLLELLDGNDSMRIISQTVPELSFDESFTAEKEEYLRSCYGYADNSDEKESVIQVISGSCAGNPFIYENRLVQGGAYETYYDSKTITWDEVIINKNGREERISHTDSVEASYSEWKPVYYRQAVLRFFSRENNGLSFERSAGHWERNTERRKNRTINKALRHSERNEADSRPACAVVFDTVFGAQNISNEKEYANLFSVFAQDSLLEILNSDAGYGDDFDFKKKGSESTVVSEHGRNLNIRPCGSDYTSTCYDIIKEGFIKKNTELFKAIYFDFAPVLAIPALQDKKPREAGEMRVGSCCSLAECEVLLNSANAGYFAHSKTKTSVILKAEFASFGTGFNKVNVRAHSFDESRWHKSVGVDGPDGKRHNVDVAYYDYNPLTENSSFFVSDKSDFNGKMPIAAHNGLYLFT